MRVGRTFSRIFTGTMIATSTLVSCTKKPFVKMPEEKITQEVRNRVASYIKESQGTLIDSTYTMFGTDTVPLYSGFQKRIQNLAKKNVEKVVVDKKLVTKHFFTGNRTEYVPEMEYIKEPKYLDPKAIVKDTTVYTRDSVTAYIPVEFWGKPNPKAVLKNK